MNTSVGWQNLRRILWMNLVDVRLTTTFTARNSFVSEVPSFRRIIRQPHPATHPVVERPLLWWQWGIRRREPVGPTDFCARYNVVSRLQLNVSAVEELIVVDMHGVFVLDRHLLRGYAFHGRCFV